MDVNGTVARAAMLRRALIRIGRGDLDDMLIDVIPMNVVKMSVVEVVDVTIMIDGGVPTIRAMSMRMIAVLGIGAGRHDRPLCLLRIAAILR
jgi:hypothetical protein